MSLVFTRTTSKWRFLGKLFLAILIASAALIGTCEHMATVRPEGNPEQVELDVKRGMSFDGLLDELESNGLVRNRLVARYILRRDEVFNHLKAGRYKFRGDLNLSEISEALRAGPNVRPIRRFTIKPGESLYEVAHTVEKLGLGSASGFLALAQDYDYARPLSRHFLGGARSERDDGESWVYLEGFLAPDTYFLDSESSIDEVVQTATKRFHETWRSVRSGASKEVLGRHQALALGDYELLSLAAMVEEETQVAREAPRIAGVFFNRLEKGMRLKSDPTAMYAKAKVGQPPTPQDIRNKANPYNTYAFSGVPPGPICAPGPAALKAVFEPESHDFLFFVAARDGSGRHVFATTGKEHMRNVNKHLRGK